MPGFVPGIHDLASPSKICTLMKDVDGRDKPGHDAKGMRNIKHPAA
jgi:hypothetical protein